MGFERQLQTILPMFNNLSDKVIQENLKHKRNNIEEDGLDREHKKFFLDYLINSGQFDSNNLRDEVNMFLFAGTETTALTLSFILVVLGMLYDKVLQEILEVIGPDRYPESKDLHNLQYTDRVIKETLRLFPVASIFGRYITKDTNLGDFVIPKYASVYFDVLYIHRNEKYWPNPLKFNPDRFLPEEQVKDCLTRLIVD
ncbi:hypothetical protein GWI33_022696 [Rhynchophorus ferrugineus]|uniref:Cytochrome P450 n=1 Tax=Rhynchophorus ferrugineus TaxID=354439 RepID=A0A834IN04_RHYFE|nr:hypothetical protein GWI33_022696 [Rhynchophorus ferrugineus]